MRRKLGKYVLPILAGSMLIFAVLHVVRAQQTPPTPPPPVEPTRSPFGKTVAGAGIAEPMTENISIGSDLPGVVREVYVPVDQVGKKVKKGDKLFKVDDRALVAQLGVLQANLEAARAQLAKLNAQPREEEKPPSAAKVAAAKANLELAEDAYQRARRLQATGAVGEEEYRQKLMGREVAHQQWMQAVKEDTLLLKGAWQPDKDIAQAAIDQVAAQIEQTKTDMVRTLVRAPVDGEVLQVNVRPGEYVGAPPNQALVVLGDTKHLHVRVDIDEHDIPRFRKDAPARASIRGSPQLQYPLRYVRIEPYVIPKKSLTGDNTERVDTRVLQVIYALDATDKPIYVGQQLDVYIDVGESGK